jgi:hypothetical protein
MINLKQNDIIKHRNFKDIALLIKSVEYSPGLGLHIAGDWINQGFDNTYLLNIDAHINITEDRITQWLVCKDPEAYNTVRNATWVAIRGGDFQ